MSVIFIRNLIFSVLLIIILAGCGKSQETEVSNEFLNNILVTLSDQPTTKNSEHSYEVFLSNKKNEPVNVDSVEMILEMEGMGHKVDGKMEKISKGVYKAKLELPMDGSWDKIVVLKQGKYTRNVSKISIKAK
ncbi:YtkA-like [Bacillus sp. OV166]|uniref:FixH family protein n=1 Tax=Bacillus sp. OV166 TaxID=1882763 RepID=UPI000A2AEE93|nr:FixH family protein [Bacillus sp. OV166]SMQ86696.1 YtkA-like [Bacillus sp. OV166]